MCNSSVNLDKESFSHNILCCICKTWMHAWRSNRSCIEEDSVKIIPRPRFKSTTTYRNAYTEDTVVELVSVVNKGTTCIAVEEHEDGYPYSPSQPHTHHTRTHAWTYVCEWVGQAAQRIPLANYLVGGCYIGIIASQTSPGNHILHRS